MADETVYVDPFFLRVAAQGLTDVGTKLGGDFGTARETITGKLRAGLAVSRAMDTLDTLWRNHLEQFKARLTDQADRLVKTADAYQRCDREAAAALGVALPVAGPVVRQRPGQVPE